MALDKTFSPPDQRKPTDQNPLRSRSSADFLDKEGLAGKGKELASRRGSDGRSPSPASVGEASIRGRSPSPESVGEASPTHVEVSTSRPEAPPSPSTSVHEAHLPANASNAEKSEPGKHKFTTEEQFKAAQSLHASAAAGRLNPDRGPARGDSAGMQPPSLASVHDTSTSAHDAPPTHVQGPKDVLDQGKVASHSSQFLRMDTLPKLFGGKSAFNEWRPPKSDTYKYSTKKEYEAARSSSLANVAIFKDRLSRDIGQLETHITLEKTVEDKAPYSAAKVEYAKRLSDLERLYPTPQKPPDSQHAAGPSSSSADRSHPAGRPLGATDGPSSSPTRVRDASTDTTEWKQPKFDKHKYTTRENYDTAKSSDVEKKSSYLGDLSYDITKLDEYIYLHVSLGSSVRPEKIIQAIDKRNEYHARWKAIRKDISDLHGKHEGEDPGTLEEAKTPIPERLQPHIKDAVKIIQMRELRRKFGKNYMMHAYRQYENLMKIKKENPGKNHHDLMRILQDKENKEKEEEKNKDRNKDRIKEKNKKEAISSYPYSLVALLQDKEIKEKNKDKNKNEPIPSFPPTAGDANLTEVLETVSSPAREDWQKRMGFWKRGTEKAKEANPPLPPVVGDANLTGVLETVSSSAREDWNRLWNFWWSSRRQSQAQSQAAVSGQNNP